MPRVKIQNRGTHELPSYQTAGSSGMDVRALLDEDLTLAPMQRVMVPTGLYVELPVDTEIQVRPRSGMAWKQGITCINTPGTIDADYRGEIKILLINLSQQPQVIRDGDRIAQLVMATVTKVEWEVTSELSDSEREDGGFGSTGKN